jgi:hypothetical protein
MKMAKIAMNKPSPRSKKRERKAVATPTSEERNNTKEMKNHGNTLSICPTNSMNCFTVSSSGIMFALPAR